MDGANQTFDLERIRRTAPKVFDQPVYDALLVVIKTLFRESSVMVNTDHSVININEKIRLHISLSDNECKAFFYSYITPKEYDFPSQANVRYAYMKTNKAFRLFALSEMVEYLQLKAKENEFIRQNEG